MATGYIPPAFDSDWLDAGTAATGRLATDTGYLTPGELFNSPQGQDWLERLTRQYSQGVSSGQYGLMGGAAGDPNNIRDAIRGAALDPSADPQLYSWMMQQGGIPSVPTLARTQMEMTDKLSRDVTAAKNETDKWLQQQNAALQQSLQQGLITHQAAMQASQQAHEKAQQAEVMALKYAELEWTKEYGTQNLQVLRDRLSWDREYGGHQLANDDQRVQIEKDRFGLDKEKFGLEKAIQEAMLKANPMNAVANALYTRGAGMPGQGGLDQYGAPTTTLDNSGILPFLQQLQGGGIQERATGGGPLNNGGTIGGNQAPQNGAISQASLGNMSDTERGITSSLAAYGGQNPNDYWKNMQATWNTGGQGRQSFGGTRMA